MSFLSDIFAGGAEGLLKGARDVVAAFRADPLELAKLEAELVRIETNLTLGLAQAQTKINEIEAASQDKFVSRWRPFIGWVCGGAYLYEFILQPFASFIIVSSGTIVNFAALPKLDMSELSMVLMGLLGLGAMRTFEKVNKK